MTINDLIAAAAGAYPEAYVLNYWDAEAREPKENPDGGDTLALFIALCEAPHKATNVESLVM
jgi:hypothetical protein